MAENRKNAAAPADAEARVSAGISRPGRAVALILLLILVGAAAYLLYNGSVFQTAIRAMTAENAEREQSVRDLTADRAEKDAELRSLGDESAEKEAAIRSLSDQAAEKEAAIRSLSAENEEKTRQLQDLEAQLAAARAPLDYQDAIRETAPAAALEALELPAELEQSEETKRSLLTPLLQGAYLEEDQANSREAHLAFTVRASDGQLLGSVAFEPAGSEAAAWTAAEERYDFSGCFKTASLTLPSDYQLYLGEQLLGAEWVREERIPYAAFVYAAEDYEDLPTMVRYETPPFLGEPDLRVLNEKGRELSAEELREQVYLDRCPAEIREKVEAFLPEFAELFLRFSADIKDSAHQYYYQLLPLVRPDSLLYRRLHAAFEGLGYSAARAVELQSVTVNCITDLGGGRYAVDLNYISLVTGHSSAFPPVEDELHLLLILTEDPDGKLLAEAMYYL